MKITEISNKKNTVQLEVIVPIETITHVQEEVVDEMIKNVTVKGFRQGKAPKSIAVSNLEPEKLNNHILSHVFNQVVTEAIKQNSYKILGRPVLEKFEPQKSGEWKVALSLALYPVLKIDKYQEQIKKITKKDKTIDDIYECLLKNVKVDVSPQLVEEEVNYSLNRLEEQAKSLNITLEKYLEAVKKTLEEVKKDYSKNAEESIKLDVILLEIAKSEKITTTKEEVDEFILASGTDPHHFNQVASIIERRKTIDYLMKI